MKIKLLAGLVLIAGALQSFAFQVRSDFESGSAKVLATNSDTQEIRITPAGDLNRGMPNWWFVRVEGIDTNKPVTLEVVAREVTMPLQTGKTATPLNPGWTLPACAAISTDGTNWSQTSAGERRGGTCVYRVTTSSKTLWLAWGPPFTPHDAMAFVEQMARIHPFVKTFTLAKSLEGRPVVGLQISEGDKPILQRPAIWITGRQHAWEVGGSWVAVGLAEWLSSNDEKAKWLRQNAEFFFVPLMDVDHVATGDGGKHARPQDHNRDWSDAPHWPEVAAAQKEILARAKEGRMAFFLDLHNPSPGSTLENFYVQYPPYVGEKAAMLTTNFLADVRAEFGEIKLTDEKPSAPEDVPVWKRISTPWVCEHGNPQTIAFTAETPWNTPQGTTEGYRAVGIKLGLAVERYLRENSTPAK